MIYLILIILAAVLGYMWRDITDRIMELEEKSKTPVKKPGVTRGSYNQVNEVHPHTTPKAKGHAVSPKTPQRVAWEAEQALKESNEKFRVGPR